MQTIIIDQLCSTYVIEYNIRSKGGGTLWKNGMATSYDTYVMILGINLRI